MPYPEEFYYESETSGVAYQKHPGRPAIHRLLRNEENGWISPAYAAEKRKKTLILADWSGVVWRERKIQAVKEIINRLLEEGFDLYIWQCGELKKLTPDLLDSRFILASMSPSSTPEEMEKIAASAYGIPSQNLLILDDYWINRLLDPTLDSLRTLNVQDFYSSSYLDQIRILSWVKRAKPPLASLLLEEYSKDAILNYQSLSHDLAMQELEPIIRYRVLTIMKLETITDLLEKGELILSNRKFRLDDCEGLEIMSLGRYGARNKETLLTSQLKQLLVRSKALKHLNLHDIHLIDDEALASEDLHHLNVLYITDCTLSVATMRTLFSPSLTSLHLKNISIDPAEFTLPENSLPLVETIDLRQSKVSPLTLKTIFAAAPKAKKIILNECVFLPILDEKNLSVEVFELAHNAPLPGTMLQMLLTALPNLTKIKIEGSITNHYISLTGPLTLPANSLLALKEATFVLEKLDDNFLTFLEAAPSLKKLNLYVSHTSKELGTGLTLRALFRPFLALEEFEEIDLIGQENSEVLAELVHYTRRLKKLSLNLCSYPNIFHLLEKSLPELEEVSLRGPVSAAFLKALLAAAPNLTKIKLEGRIEEFKLECHLPKLKELDLGNSKMLPGSVLQTLLIAAPNLEKINLHNSAGFCKSLGSDLDESTVCTLPNVKEIVIPPRTNVSADVLKFLIKATTRLKRLDLQHKSIIGVVNNRFDIKFYSEILPEHMDELEEISLFGSSIDQRTLNFLLEKTPHLKSIKMQFVKESLDLATFFTRKVGLEQVTLTNTMINQTTIEALLSNPSIKEIMLTEVFINTGSLRFAPGSLLHLQTIVIETQNLNPAWIETLRKAAPQALITVVNENHTSSLIETPAPQDVSHDPLHQMHFRPTPPDKAFQFKGTHQTRNQTMIIEKLSQYLTVKKKHLAIIPRLQDGICSTLKEFFLDHKRAEWETFLTETLAWNGQATTLTPYLESIFERLYTYYDMHEQKTSHHAYYYLGNHLSRFLSSCPSPCRLGNPWHAIVIRKKKWSTLWEVYDPNFVDGVKEVTTSKLFSTIHHSLGNLVAVELNQAPPHSVRITDKERFLKEGGLFTLLQCANQEQLLKTLIPTGRLSITALEGLCLRNTEGVPAWILGLKDPALLTLTLSLLQQLIKQSGKEGKKKLAESLDCLTPSQQHTYIVCYIQTSLAKNEAINTDIIDIIRTTSNLGMDYQSRLQTWEKKSTTAPTLSSYCHSLLSLHKKRLVECDTESQADALRYSLQDYCRMMHHPVFYVHSPNDLICTSPSMDASGNIKPGPSGRLHEFLTRHEKGVIIVNYSAFKASDLVRFNTLLDKERKADGTKIPKDMIIVGLLNHDSTTPIPGSDVYSRFDKVEHCALTATQLEKAIPPLPSPVLEDPPAGAGARYTSINLYHASDWESLLVGQWVPREGGWYYKEGPLLHALRDGEARTIEIQNGLWENKDFCRFFREALQSGEIHYPGGSISIPASCRFLRDEGYAWETLKHAFVQESTLPEEGVLALNPETCSDFFRQYKIVAGDNLEETPGFIQLAETKTPKVLFVHVTHHLPDDHWAMLLKSCQEKRVKLHAYCAPGVILPEPLRSATITSAVVTHPARTGFSVIQSTDTDTTVAFLQQSQPDMLILEVSECDVNDLITRMESKIISDDSGLHLAFTETTCALLDALKSKRPVLLKGHFSSTLAQQLAPLLLTRPNVILLSEDTSALHYLGEPLQHHVSTDEKTERLAHAVGPLEATIYLMIEPYLAREPLSKLITRYRFLKANPHRSSDEAWIGLKSIAHTPGTIEPLVEANAADLAQSFMTARYTAIEAVLARSPYVFLSGLSGVGKSTFVTKEFSKGNCILYQSTTALTKWATDTTPGKRKILFIDEANLENKLRYFEGLYNDPPGILVNGIYYPLTPEHKVIFAGNPVNYGDERSLAPLFERHGNAVLFEPLSSAVLYEQIIKPVFENTPLASQTEAISKPFLDVYAFLCRHSETDVLISPRELQMMALLTLAHTLNTGKLANLQTIAQTMAYRIAKHLVPAAHHEEFERLFKVESLPITKAKIGEESNYLITPSRQSAYQLLDDFLALREIRHETGNEAQQYGGLGGMIFEGEPSVGKSELVIATLIERGYKEIHDFSAPVSVDRPFYRLPVSMAIAEKEALLLKAFNEGAVVIIDEINSSPMMEKLLNSLLMGLTPDGKRPDKPGFMIIGTQNPITMAGRRAMSTALNRRLATVELPPYSFEELSMILRDRGVFPQTADTLVNTYLTQLDYAQRNELKPPPTLRDLLRIADDVIREQKAILDSTVQRPISITTFRMFKPNPAISGPTTWLEVKEKYIGSNPKVTGLLGDYLKQRAATYWFQDLCASFIALCFGCFNYKTEQMKRQEYISQLSGAITTCIDDPGTVQEELVTDLLNKGLKDFRPRKQGSDKSLNTLLQQLRSELPSLNLMPPRSGSEQL
jgi:hypothetical protein